MKTTIKTAIILMTLSLVLLAFASCDLISGISPEPKPEPEQGCQHSWVDATCLSPKTCSACGLTDGAALGHSEEALAGKDATCTEAGLTDGKKCSVCGEITLAQEEISALGHTEEIMVGEDPTCTSTGLTDGKKCSVCYEILVAQEEIDMAEHSEQLVEGTAATCTSKGITDGKVCSVCGETLLAQEEIPENGHKDEDNDFECDVCHVDLCVDHVPADAVEENRAEATCQEKGSYDLVVKCSKCGEEISREEKEIPKLDHNEEIIPSVGATCKSTGLTEGKKCTSCGETLVAQEEIPMADHTEEAVPGKAATCTETGLTDGKKCSVCGETTLEQEEIPAGHNIVDGTCTACGHIPNVFAGKQFVASADAAANMYSANYGYQTITDGVIYEEAKGRYSSKQNGGKIEAIIDLGAIYELDEFKIYLYWNDGINRFGSGLKIQVLFAGEWTTVVDCKNVEELQAYWVDNPDSVDKEWLVFDLNGVVAKQVMFTIPGQTSLGWSTFYEMECSAKLSDQVEPEPEEPVLIDNVFAGKQFNPTDAAKTSVLSASWWKGSGYEGLTDGIKNADNAPGRFSTIMKTTGMMDATIDLGGSYELHTLKLYTYDPAAGTGATSLGSDLLIQVYSDGEWKDVVICADNATVESYLVVNEGTYNDYLEFDLEGINAEKVRIYISASASASGTTYEEIECNGYAK